MKFLLIKVTVFFLLIISFSEKTFSKEFRAIYKIEIGSINIGSLDWVINIGTDNFRTSLLLKDKGVLSGLYKFSGEYVSEGKIFQSKFFSSKYYQFWKTKKKKREIEIFFNDTMVSSLAQKPRERELPRTKYINIVGFCDPLASFLNILFNDKNDFKTIDGRRIYKMSVKSVNKEGSKVSKKIFITNYLNLWTDHKKRDLNFIFTEQNMLEKDYFLPKMIKIKNRGLVFKLTKI